MRTKNSFRGQVLGGKRGVIVDKRLTKNEAVFKALTGQTVDGFNAICAVYEPKFLVSEHARLRNQDRIRGIGAGARHQLSIRDRVAVTLVSTKKDQQIASAVFGISPSAVSKIVKRHRDELAVVVEREEKRLAISGAAAEAAAEAAAAKAERPRQPEPRARGAAAAPARAGRAKRPPPPKDPQPDLEEIGRELEEEREWALRNPTLSLLYPGGEASVDFTMFDVLRPIDKDDRGEWYTYKKRHAGKVLIVTNRWGRLGYRSDRFPGSHNDQSLAPVCLPGGLLRRLRHTMADGSFAAHAAQADYNMLIPFKNPRKGELGGDKKAYNKWQRSRRAIVENAIPALKRYNSLSMTKCADHDKFNSCLRLVCALVNFRTTRRRFGLSPGGQVPEREIKPCPVPAWTVKRQRVFHHGTKKSRPYSARPPIP